MPAEQDDITPGSTIFLRAVLTEYGQPLQGHAQVEVTMIRPDGTTVQETMLRSGPGEYGGHFVAITSGAYRFRIRAEGLSARGHTFTREHLLSALVGRSAGDSRDGPADGGGADDIIALLCELWACMSKRRLLDDRFLEKLAEWGIDGEEASRCLQEICRSGDVSRVRAILRRRTGGSNA